MKLTTALPASLMSEMQSTEAQVDNALRVRSFWRVALPGELEQEFQQDRMADHLQHCIRSGWLALIVFNSFLLVDWLMARDVFWNSVVVRLLIFSPLGILLLISSHRHRQAILASRNPHITNWIVAVSGYGAAICLAVILLISKSPMIMYYHAGMMVVMFYGTMVQHLHYKAGIAFLAAILALQVMCGAYGQPMPGPIKLAMTEMLLVAAIFCVVASITVEKARRKRYLLLRRERNLSESLLSVNMKLQELSRSDVLTGVANRRHLHEHLQQVWDRAVADHTPVSALMLDVDHFKAYNDRYGHPAGDECLKQVAHSVSGSLRRPDDFVARYGGEEFVALLPGTPSEVATQAAERVRQGVEALAMRHEGSSTGKVVTISIGVATLYPGQTSLGPDQLISMADQALYEAKRGTRNCVRVKVT